jgi:hypothetical protein
MERSGKGSLAETEGFEPSVQMYPYDGLANRWFQPLTHVSGLQQYSGAYSEGLGQRQELSNDSFGRKSDSPCRGMLAGWSTLDS